MILAKVTGKVVATQKTKALEGSKLLIIVEIDQDQNSSDNASTYIAIDMVGAGQGDIVLVDWGYSAYEFSGMSADMSIVGIVDHIQFD
ncbi:MAG: ethanolamine utilization protein EutN [Bacillota bacterium]|jgi:ethanolamine utilization protein EutN|nr:ethanolamine utilization protein EutN [Bacillota bacterium]